MDKKITTLCIVQQGEKILLGMKKRGFGQGRWNGFGGKVKEKESLEETAKRELFEECGISVERMEKMGTIDFCWNCRPDVMEVNFFKIKNFLGIPAESEEMRPQWFDVEKIPFDEMWQDDKHWMPLFLNDKKFKGKFLFDGSDNILEKDLKEVDEV